MGWTFQNVLHSVCGSRSFTFARSITISQTSNPWRSLSEPICTEGRGALEVPDGTGRDPSHAAFAETFLERITEFLRQRPAYLKLLVAPIRFSRDPVARRALRVAIANAFRAKDPSLTNEKAMLAANITLQMVKGMTTLYAEAGPREKPLTITEYKKALTLYLGSVLSEDKRSSKERQR